MITALIQELLRGVSQWLGKIEASVKDVQTAGLPTPAKVASRAGDLVVVVQRMICYVVLWPC